MGALRTGPVVWLIAGALAFASVACGSEDDADDTEAETTEPTEPAGPASTGPGEETEGAEGPRITLGEPDADGVIPVTINPDAVSPLTFIPVDESAADPFWHIHTEDDDLFLGIELYTVYGPGWTGELGTFETDCTANGICVLFDPDGKGPEKLAEDVRGEGTIEIVKLDESGYEVTLAGITFADDGTTYRLDALTLAG